MAAVASQNVSDHVLGQVIKSLAQGTEPTKHDIVAELNYHKDDGNPLEPYYVETQKPPARPNTPRTVTIHDVSGEEDKYTLDNHGFQFVKHESKDKEFLDEEKIKAEYYPEMEQFIKDVTGAFRVFIFNHAIRRSAEDRPQGPGPARRVHVDQAYQTAENYVKYFLPDDAKELSGKRFQVINAWRPIKPIRRDPFAIADAKSVPDSDLLAAARIYRDRVDETWAVKPNPNHRWYFKYAQQPDEVVLFKCYDSLDDGRARRNPHSAFSDPAYVDEPIRESIEVAILGLKKYIQPRFSLELFELKATLLVLSGGAWVVDQCHWAAPSIFGSIGLSAFYIYAVFNLLTIAIVYCFYPETSNRTLEEIDLLFASKILFVWETEKRFRELKLEHSNLVRGGRQSLEQKAENDIGIVTEKNV